MRINPVSGQVLDGPLEPVYVYEAPVRLWHWVMMVAMFFLAVTGYLIGSPPPAIGGEAAYHYMFGYIRMTHFIAAMVFAVAFLVRIYWAFVGNHSCAGDLRSAGVERRAGGRASSGRWATTCSSAGSPSCGWVTIRSRRSRCSRCTRSARSSSSSRGWRCTPSSGAGARTPMNLMGWVFVLFGDPQMVRTLHHLAMWYLVLFAVIHMYMVFREDIMSGESVIGTMINGIRMWKREPKA